MLAFYRKLTRSLKKGTRRLKGGGKGLKPGQGQKKLAKEAAEKAAAAAGAGGAGNGAPGGGAAAAAAPAETAAAKCERISREVCARKEEQWATTVADQRHTKMIRVISIDGMQKDGQFQITVASLPPPDVLVADKSVPIETKVMVGVDFLKHPGEKKARVACPELLKIGAYVLLKMGEGQLFSHKTGMGFYRGVQITRDVSMTYADLAAVIPPDVAERWIAEGKLLAVSRW